MKKRSIFDKIFYKSHSSSIHGLLVELKRIAKSSKSGKFITVADSGSLSSEEREAVSLLNKIGKNYQDASEYDLMKYRLTSDALSIALWDMDVISGDPVNPKNKFTWSQEFRQMLGFTDKSDFPNLLHSWSDRLHPEDKERTLNAFAAHLSDCTGETPYDLEYRLMLKNGQYRHFRAFGTSLRDSAGVPLRVAGALQDITEKKQIEETIKYREELMRTLNNAAITFLSQTKGSFDETMTAGVRLIVDMVKADRVSLWRNFTSHDGLHSSQIYRWDRDSGGTTIPTAGLEDVTYSALAPRWEKLFASDESINSPVHLLPESAMLQSFGIVSAYITPVFIGNQFWGFALFEDRHNERYFDEESVEMMHSAAFLCVNTVIMNEKTQNAENALKELQQREKMMSAINETAMMLLEDNTKNFNDVMSNSLKPIAAAAGIDRIAVYRLLDDKDQLGQVYLWYGETLPLEEELVMLPDIPPIRRWLEIATKGGYVNINVKDAQKDEVEFLTLFGVKSVFMVPIFARGEFWGVITLEDHTNYRFFEEESLDLLYSAAHLCAGAIVRAEMEKAVIEAQELMRNVMEANPISYVLFNEDMHVIDCNETMMHILGCNDKQYFMDHYWEHFVPETQPSGDRSFEKAIARRDDAIVGEQTRFEWVHKSLSGELIPMENTLTRVTHNGKKLIISFKYDLRSTKKMMENISEQSELLKNRLEQQELITDISRGFISSGDAQLYVKDAITKLGHYHKASSVFIFRIDYDIKKTFLSYHWSDENTPLHPIKFDLFSMVKSSFPEKLPDCATLPIISCEDTSAAQNLVFRKLLAANIYAFIGAPLYAEGRLWGIISVVQRFKPRQWTDTEKRFVAITAGTIAGVIMRDIYNKMLNNALEKATTASKAKGEFLSNMSHEMRTPLNAIIGMTMIGKNSEELSRKDYALDKIEDASTHLLGVINDVLDISKIEANKFELSPVEFNFEKMLQRVINVVHFRVDEKKQKLSVYIDKSIPGFMIGDDQRIAQVITNLLGNAVKFTPDNGSIVLDANFLGEEDGLCTIQIMVKDSGIGISPEQQKRLFMSFHQAESSTVRKYGGTGLGLAISKSIVEMMGGKIRVESEVDKGSAFIFTIQVERGKEKTQALSAPCLSLSAARILVVDDDPDVLEYISEIIQRFGASCDTAGGGEEALRLIEQNGTYDINFIDWKMPGMNGIELTAKIKEKISGSDNSIVIMISAVQWNNVEADAKKAGVDKFLPKPLFPSAIGDIINDCLGIEKQQTTEPSQTIDGLFRGHRILLVEDMEINREILMTILEPTGLEIDSAENGAKAVKMYSEKPERYEMIFMDVQMPEMDGYDATRIIREVESKLPSVRRIPIIAMTANVFKEDIEKCIKAGMDDHIGKPIDFDIVIEKIKTYLK